MLKCAESACHGCGGGAVGDGGAGEGASAVADSEDIVYLIGRSCRSPFSVAIFALACMFSLLERETNFKESLGSTEIDVILKRYSRSSSPLDWFVERTYA